MNATLLDTAIFNILAFICGAFLGQRSIESINNFLKSKSMKTNLLIIKKKKLSYFVFYFINVTFQVTLE